MAIDTAKKRNSALAFSTMLLPIPDGTIDQADRQTLLYLYGGILAGVAEVAAMTKDFIQSMIQPMIEPMIEPMIGRVPK